MFISTFGQASLLAGDTDTGALFAGSSGFITAHVPKPSKFDQGNSFEFWYKLAGGASARQPEGIFDTNNGAIGGLKNTGYPIDTLPGFVWNTNRPFVGFVSPSGAVHCAVVFRGNNIMDVFLNGLLYNTFSIFGNGTVPWINPFWIGKAAIAGYTSTHFFDGTLQDFAIYNYPLSSSQVYTHFIAGSLAPSTTGQGVFTLQIPLPYAPAIGDQFIAYPGCSKVLRVCENKFNNRLQYGGSPFVPDPENGA
mgnify:CR=1 FL=1